MIMYSTIMSVFMSIYSVVCGVTRLVAISLGIIEFDPHDRQCTTCDNGTMITQEHCDDCMERMENEMVFI